MGSYYKDPSIVGTVQGIQTQLAAVQRQTQQFSLPVAQAVNVSLSIATGTGSAVAFTSVDVDSHSMWNVLDPTRITPPFPGIYAATGKCAFNAGGGAIRILTITKTGTTPVQSRLQVPPVGSGFDTYLSVAGVFKVLQDEYFTLTPAQDTGAPLTIASVALSVNWLGTG